MIIVQRGVAKYLLVSSFDDQKDEYDSDYTVYLMPGLKTSELKGDWEQLKAKALQLLGKIPVSDIRFDTTKRKEMDTSMLARLFD